ncbi:energy transducer TonB [Azovibrio restrictus]|uniref:energy transducer TonB n=1 Tax=Azovibrio restrictus TaxID=146938 RepID=UPI0026F20E3E|nr:energy transducer TonB [Azovibrio restrictus]MDD3484111.1 energy transducer TonB [Azovibrio restrictus]
MDLSLKPCLTDLPLSQERGGAAWPPPSGFARAMTTSLLLHWAALALLLLAPPVLLPASPPAAIEVALGWAPQAAPAPAQPQPAQAAPPQHKPQHKPRHPPRQQLLSRSSLAPPEAAPEVQEPAPPQTPAAPAAPAQASVSPAAAGSSASAPAAPGAGAPGSHPYVVDGPEPPYPSEAREAGREGRVRVRVLISASGRVEEIRLQEGSGTPSLDQAALQTLARWRFHPAYRNGLPVPAWVVVPVLFSLR